MAFLDGGVPPEAAVLNLMTREDVLGRFDAESELVRWLLHQLATTTMSSTQTTWFLNTARIRCDCTKCLWVH